MNRKKYRAEVLILVPVLIWAAPGWAQECTTCWTRQCGPNPKHLSTCLPAESQADRGFQQLDLDEDGVPDREDACINDKGDAVARGCPIPEEAQSAFSRALVSLERGRHQEALLELERAQELAPSWSGVLQQLGGLYEKLQKYKEAADTYQRLLPALEGEAASRMEKRISTLRSRKPEPVAEAADQRIKLGAKQPFPSQPVAQTLPPPTPAKPAAPNAGRIIGSWSFGLGMVGSAAAVYFAIEGNRNRELLQKGELEDKAAIQKVVDDGNTSNVYAQNIGVVSAGMVLVGMILTAINPAPEPASTKPTVAIDSRGGVSVSGRF